MTKYTPNYHLDLYEDSDKPNLRGQYNAAITEIDQILFGLSNGQIAINNNIATLQTQVKNNETEIAENLAAITKINGDIDGINVKLATDEANITSLQSGLESTNQNVSQTAGEVLAINGTLNTHDTRITTAQTTANEASAKATTAQQETATQGAYWQALDVSTVDEAQDLNTDIQDAHTTSMANQADIAEIKKSGLSFKFEKGELLSPNNWTTGSISVFKNPNNSLIKLAAVLKARATTSSALTQQGVIIPGSSSYGLPLIDLSDIFDAGQLSEPLVYKYLMIGVGGYLNITDTSGPNPTATMDSWDAVLGTDGKLYMYLGSQSTNIIPVKYAINWWIPQVVITTTNYHLNPDETSPYSMHSNIHVGVPISELTEANPFNA